MCTHLNTPDFWSAGRRRRTTARVCCARGRPASTSSLQITEGRHPAAAARLVGSGGDDVDLFAQLLIGYEAAPDVSGDGTITEEYSNPDMTETVH